MHKHNRVDSPMYPPEWGIQANPSYLLSSPHHPWMSYHGWEGIVILATQAHLLWFCCSACNQMNPTSSGCPWCLVFFVFLSVLLSSKGALHPVKHKEFSPLPTAVSSKWKRWLSERTNIHHWKQPSTEGCILPHCVCVAPVKVLSNAFIN